MSPKLSGTIAKCALVLLLAGIQESATAQVVLNENFDDVIALGGVSNSGTPNVCLNSNCSVLTSGILIGSTGNSNAGPAPAGANTAPDNANVRRGDNMINTSTGASGFDNFFSTSSTNGILVLGDDSNRLTDGSPNNGLSFFRIPFVIGIGTSSAIIGFNWAFDGVDTDAGYNDTLTVRVIDATTFAPLFTVLSRGSQSASSGFGTGSVSTLWNSLNGFAAGAYQLEFLLAETTTNNNTQSGAGFDNILVSVTAVPLPAAGWLMLGGLAMLSRLRRRTTPTSR